MSTETMPTIEEREFLMKSPSAHYSGFTPRPKEKLTRKRPPRTMLNIECQHVARGSVGESMQGHSSMEYRLWLEAGKHPPPYPTRPDPNYNSNVWSNFRQHFGFKTTNEGKKITEMIAAMYPLNIPPPSKVGQYSYGKFLQETPIIRNEKQRAVAIQRTNNEAFEFKRLKAKSEGRNPPIDMQGNILPPEHFKRYVRENQPPPLPDYSKPEPENLEDKRIDIFGRYVKNLERHKPTLRWKFSHRTNHPDYDKMLQEYEKRKKSPEWKRHFPSPLYPNDD